MDTGVIIIIAAIAITTLIYVVRYVMNKAFDAGADAIKNAYGRKKESKKTESSENLVDRYKK